MDNSIHLDGLYFLKRNPLFGPLGEEVLMELVAALSPQSIDRGHALVKEGDPGTSLYLVKSGRLRIVSHHDGKDQTVTYLGRGDAIGELTLLTGEPHPFSVIADTPCDLLRLGKSEFDAVLETHPLVGIHLTRALSKRLVVTSHPHERPREPKRIHLFPALPHEALILFSANLGLALVEQTRRRVILVDMTPRSGDIARALGLTTPMALDQLLRPEDFLDITALRHLTTIHASGLEVLSLHPKLLRDHLLGIVPSLLGLLKDHYDYALLIGAAEKDELNAILLREADQAMAVVWDQAMGMADSALLWLQSACQEETTPLLTVLLHHPSSHGAIAPDYRIPWTDSTHRPLREHGSPYLSPEDSAETIRGVERVARGLGRLRVGLALGSGAAYGYALIGLLKVFEREGIPVDLAAGTSMGALLGSFYCAGNSAERVREIARTITKQWLRKNILGDLTLPHSGFLAGQTLGAFLRSILGTIEFDEMRIPFAAVATDIRTGHEVVLKEGRVADAVRASTSLPIIFQPFPWNGRYLVDGGLINPVPTSVVANMGADILISVNLTAKPSLRKISAKPKRFSLVPQAPGLSEVFFKMIYTMQYEIALARTEIAHVAITPDLRDFAWTDFHRSEEILKVGEAAAEEALSKIKRLLPFFADHCQVPLGLSSRAFG